MYTRILHSVEFSDIYQMRTGMIFKEKNTESKDYKKIIFAVVVFLVIAIVALNLITYFMSAQN